MALGLQLEMFSEQDEFSLLMKEIDAVRTECSNVRKGIFSRFDIVKKDVMDMLVKQQQEIELLKSMIQPKNPSQKFIKTKVSREKTSTFASYPKLLCSC